MDIETDPNLPRVGQKRTRRLREAGTIQRSPTPYAPPIVSA